MCVMCSTSVPTLFQNFFFFTITSLHSFTFFMKCFLLLVYVGMPRGENGARIKRVHQFYARTLPKNLVQSLISRFYLVHG